MKLLTPRQVVGLVEHGYEEIEQLIGLVPRAIALLDSAELLIERVNGVVTRIELTDQRANDVVAEAHRVVVRTTAVVDSAAGLTNRVTAMLEPVERLMPLVEKVADSVTPSDAAALAKLVQDLPEIVGTLQRDILPVLDTFGTVAPDLRDLLDASRDLNEILGALPGLGRAKRRLDDQADEDSTKREYLADEEISTAPDRATD
jgi:archaellum component FlaC